MALFIFIKLLMNKVLSAIFISLISLGCSKSNSPGNPIPITPVKPPDTVTTVTTGGAKAVNKTNTQKVYVHYMAWFEDPTTSGTGHWGQHWTMANQNPDITLSNGRRQIASWFYPMIGPYASSNRDVIDYHLLLMKYAGIDGVIVDWYGTHNVLDYPLVKRNTDSLFNRVPGAGLQFGICYEDATLGKVKSVAGIDTITAANQDFTYLQSNYFNSSSYIKINNQPLLLCFGPQGMKKTGDWQQAFSGLTTQPRLLSLEYQGNITGSAGSGEFAWVSSTSLADLQGFYQNRAPQIGTAFAGAYPGFKDFYMPGGWGNTLFVIDHNGTSTLQSTLNAAKGSNLPNLQLITWNDYGEGTMIEPTLDFNFDFLKTIQQYTGVTYTQIELQLIYKWYTLRKKYAGNIAIQQKLTNAYNSLVALDVATATTIISGIN
ncbi:MAG: endo-alpha-mannosidase [Mucilaginibacter sp.]|nr:endo-alpha-mannosidase [Mucilaginibacter sp.]